MNIDLFNNLINYAEKNNLIHDFTKELSNHLKDTNIGVENMCDNVIEEENLKEEGCLYQVVDISLEGAFLQNTKNNKVFEEKEIPQELLEKLEPDFVLRYKDGNYVFEEEITDDFLNSLIGVNEFREIKEKFKSETNILEINPDAKYKIVNRDENNSVLEYEDINITVPNELIPFFVNDETVLKYVDGQFEKYIEE